MLVVGGGCIAEEHVQRGLLLGLKPSAPMMDIQAQQR